MEKVKKESTRKKVSRSSNITSKEVAEHGKIQPQAVDLEEAVLGAMMLEKDAVSAVIDILSPAVFYKENVLSRKARCLRQVVMSAFWLIKGNRSQTLFCFNLAA